MGYRTLPPAINPSTGLANRLTFLDINDTFGGPGGALPPTSGIYNKQGSYTYIVPDGITTMQALAVGGGGGGSAGTNEDNPCGSYRGGGGGGGGGGQVAYNASFTVQGGDVIQVVVGAGGNIGYGQAGVGTAGLCMAIKGKDGQPSSITITSRLGGNSLTAAGGIGGQGPGGLGGASGCGKAAGAVTQITTSSGLSVHGGSGGGGSGAAGGTNNGPWARGLGGAGVSRTVGTFTYNNLGKGGDGGSPTIQWLTYCTAAWDGAGTPSTTPIRRNGREITTIPGKGGNGGAAGYSEVTYQSALATINVTGYISSNTFYVSANSGNSLPIAVGSFILTSAAAPTPTTAYILIIGQSMANYGPYFPSGTDYTPAGDVQRLTRTGTWETATSPGTATRLSTGYNWSSGSAVADPGGVSGGNIEGRLGDALIATGIYNAVRLFNVSVGGSTLKAWLSTAASTDYNSGTPLAEDHFTYTANKLYERIQYAVNQALTQSVTFTHVFYQGGETDNYPAATTYANYLSYFAQLRSDLTNLGIGTTLAPIPKLISKTSYTLDGSSNVTTNSTVTSAQQYIVENYTDVWPGPNTDYYGNSYRWNGINYNASGFNYIARDWANAVSAVAVGVTSPSYFVNNSTSVVVYNNPMTTTSLNTATTTALLSGSASSGASTWSIVSQVNNYQYYVGSVSNPVAFIANYANVTSSAVLVPPGDGALGGEGMAALYSAQVATSGNNTPFLCYYRGGTYVPDIPINNNIPNVSGKGVTPIKLCQFYGAAGAFCYTYTLASGAYDQSFNLHDRVVAAGWTGGTITATLNINGVLGGCRNTGAVAYYSGDTARWGTTLPKVTMTVGTSTGIITGWGGLFEAGGNAMTLGHNTTILNYGIIQAGAGAGVGTYYRDDPGGAGGAGYPNGRGATIQSGGFPPLGSSQIRSFWPWNTYTVWGWGGYGGGWVANNTGANVGDTGSPSVDGWGGSGRIQEHNTGFAPIGCALTQAAMLAWASLSNATFGGLWYGNIGYGCYYHGGYPPGKSIVNYNAYATYSEPTDPTNGKTGVKRGDTLG